MKNFKEWLQLNENDWQNWPADRLLNNVWDSLGAVYGTGQGFGELTNKLLTAAGQIGDPKTANKVRTAAQALSQLAGIFMSHTPEPRIGVQHLQDVVSRNIQSVLGR